MSRRFSYSKAFLAELLDAPCAYCGATETEMEPDHVMPISRGGDDVPQNLAPACSRCNREKRDRTPEEWRFDRLAKGRAWPPANVDDVLLSVARHVAVAADSALEVPAPNVRVIWLQHMALRHSGAIDATADWAVARRLRTARRVI
jgi:hypothetical protein